MKKTVFLSLLSLLLIPITSHAIEAYKTRGDSACGGTIYMNDDCSDSKHHVWHVSCCPDGYRVQGVHFAKHTSHDTIDTISSYCRSVNKGNEATDNSDFGPEKRINAYCHKSEILTGLVWKDKLTRTGQKRDSMIDIAPVCLNPSNGKKRIAKNMTGPNPNYKTEVGLPKRVVGIALKEHLFDTTDCAAIVVK